MTTADDRRELLRGSLIALGASPEELDAAEREGRLPLLATELALWPGRERITVAEAARRSGVPESIVRTALLRLGLAVPGEGEARLTAPAVDALLVFRGGADLFGEDVILQFTRVVGAACSAIAEAAVSVFGAGIASGRLAAETDQIAYAATVLDTTMTFGTLGPAVDIVLRQHFEAAIARLEPRESGREVPFAIAFVDLIGSTAVGQRVDPSVFAAALGEFDDRVADIAGEHGVRLVKLLGDGAMLAARDPVVLVDACRALLDAVRGRPLLDEARAGVTLGPVAARDGDYYGSVVNLAARVVVVSAPGEILCDEQVAAALGERAEPAGSHTLYGFDTPVPLFRVR